VLKTQLRLYDWGQYYEKMLYDNAQLARAYLHAWQITGDPFFKQVVTETLDFIAREMTHPEGGFYSSLDADSEGEEGRFYVWNLDEIRATLKDDSDFFEAAYGVTAKGNFEGHTILQRALDNVSLAARFKIDPETVSAKLTDCHAKLLSVRASRIRPGTDDKVLTSWNGLMLATMAEASHVIARSDQRERRSNLLIELEIASGKSTPRNDIYYTLATRSAEFLLVEIRKNGRLCRAWRNGKPRMKFF